MSQSFGFYYGNTDSPSKIEGAAGGRGNMIRGRNHTPSHLWGTPPVSGGEFLSPSPLLGTPPVSGGEFLSPSPLLGTPPVSGGRVSQPLAPWGTPES